MILDIILLTHNRLENTLQCIDALYGNTQVPFQITVIDDSTDLTPIYLSGLIKERGNVRVVNPDVVISSANQAINIGLKQTQSNPVLFLCNSTFVEPDWLPLSLKLMENIEKVGLVGFKLLFPFTSVIIEAGDHVYPDTKRVNMGRGLASHKYTHIRQVNAIGWAAILINREALPKNGLEEDYYLGFVGVDDFDNCLEIKKRGWNIIYNGYGVVYHQLGRSESNNWADVAENNRRFIERWKGRVPPI